MIIVSKLKKIIGNFVKKSYWYQVVEFKDCQKLWDYNTFNTDIVNLGSTSGVCAFIYDGIPYKCANWALGTNTPLGDRQILYNYSGYLKTEGAIVIIPICPFSSYAGIYQTLDDRFYTLLHPSSIPGYSYRHQQRINDRRNRPLANYPIAGIKRDITFIRKGTPKLVLSEEQMVSDAKKWVADWMKEFSISDFNAPVSLINQDGIDDTATLINQMIAYCHHLSATPVILIPPVYHTLSEELTTEIRKKIIDALIEKLNLKGVWYHDYIDDEQFAQEKSLFSNSFLLNEKGARLFTKRVLEDLKVI